MPNKNKDVIESLSSGSRTGEDSIPYVLLLLLFVLFSRERSVVSDEEGFVHCTAGRRVNVRESPSVPEEIARSRTRKSID